MLTHDYLSSVAVAYNAVLFSSSLNSFRGHIACYGSVNPFEWHGMASGFIPRERPIDGIKQPLKKDAFFMVLLKFSNNFQK